MRTVEYAKHGLNMSRNPFEAIKEEYEGTPPEQKQEWPGKDSDMIPLADHGEETYQGANKLEGLKALITGGDSGIGRAVAIAFAREGADVAIGYLNEDEDADETMRWVKEAGRKGLSIGADLRKHQECRRLVTESARELGGLNIVVNNAAVHHETANFRDISPEQLESTFFTNILSYFWVAQAALDYLQPGDTIINSGSVVGQMGYPSLIDYSTTKGAITTFTKSLAQALADEGIRVNCVAPGPVWTPLIPSTREPGFVGEFGGNTFWKRPAQPSEIAPSYVFLASTDSRYYTGEIISPSGFKVTTR